MIIIKRSCILFVSLFVFCLEAMEQEAKPVRRNVVKCKEFIDLDESQIKTLEYHVGANIQFFKEYVANNRDGSTVSFPKNRTDPVPIRTFGSLRYFFTSASMSNRGIEHGMSVLIDDQSVERIITVRGRVLSNNNKIYVYLGIDPSKSKKVGYKGCNTIYAAKIVAMQMRDIRYDGKAQCELYIYNGKERSEPNWSKTQLLNNMQMFQELKKYLPDEKDWNANSPKFHEKIKELLGDASQFWDQKMHLLYSNVVYWTETENRLKGTQYTKK